ncbi:Uncharacterised protein [uncultured archaeon]|nr:Uncharacterised protein [uncultured archaeon]
MVLELENMRFGTELIKRGFAKMPQQFPRRKLCKPGAGFLQFMKRRG